jgi:hypothetical protein
MDAVYWIVIAIVAVLVVVALAAWAYARSRRRTALKEQFGPEYDRTLGEAGSRRRAERELAERERAHEQLDIRPLSQAARDRYVEDWQRAEQQFVDDPELAARQADRTVRSVLEERGYPSDDFDSQAAAVSVDHPHVVERYRHGHDMVHGNGAAGDERTENLRKAMVDFRAVFEQLVEDVETHDEVEEPATRA